MKKNVKYLGAAAAALLAVAPVVASTTVANAATIQVQGGAAQPAAKGGNIVATLTATNVSSLKKGANPDSVTADLSAALNGQAITPKVFGSGKAYVVPAKANVTTQAEAEAAAAPILKSGLQPDTEYKLVVPQVGFQNLSTDKNAKYTYNGINNTLTVDAYGNSSVVPVESAPFEIATGNAYFVQNNTVVSGSTSVDLGNVNTVSGLATKIQNEVKASNTNDKLQQSNKANLETQIKNALANAGVAVTTNGSFTAPVTNFIVPYTATFPNGASATINVVVKVSNTTPSAYTANGPQFALNGTNKNIVAVDAAKGSYKLSVKQGTNFDANALVKAFNVTYSSTNGARLTTASVASNNVNTAVAGQYNVVLSATNPAGVTNKVNVAVTVDSNGQTTRTVNYVKGYSVVAWNINGNRATISSNKFAAGSTVNTVGAPITVAGVQYYKIAGTSNEYIQAQYVDGSWKPSKPSTSTSTSKEEKASGVIVVKYNGRGQVRLLDGNGKYTNNYVAKNAAFKVFAKKTINGKTYYRLGTQSQWIPAQYAMFR